jgi:hypothetical protein
MVTAEKSLTHAPVKRNAEVPPSAWLQYQQLRARGAASKQKRDCRQLVWSYGWYHASCLDTNQRSGVVEFKLIHSIKRFGKNLSRQVESWSGLRHFLYS